MATPIVTTAIKQAQLPAPMCTGRPSISARRQYTTPISTVFATMTTDTMRRAVASRTSSHSQPLVEQLVDLPAPRFSPARGLTTAPRRVAVARRRWSSGSSRHSRPKPPKTSWNPSDDYLNESTAQDTRKVLHIRNYVASQPLPHVSFLVTGRPLASGSHLVQDGCDQAFAVVPTMSCRPDWGVDLGARRAREVRRRDGVRPSTGRPLAGRPGCSEASSGARDRRGGRAASQSRPSPAHRKEPYPTSLGDPKPNPTKPWGTSSTFMWRIVGFESCFGASAVPDRAAEFLHLW